MLSDIIFVHFVRSRQTLTMRMAMTNKMAATKRALLMPTYSWKTIQVMLSMQDIKGERSIKSSACIRVVCLGMTVPCKNLDIAHQGSSQRSQGVAARYALTVDVPVPLRLQKRRYAFDVFILLVFSSVRESIASGSQVHETRRAKWGRCVFLFLHFRR